MKKFLLAASLITTAFIGQAQTSTNKLAPLDKSPMDMSYYPVNFPVLKIQDKANEPLVARVIYSRPQKNNRTIYGELVEYNKLWRLGANEATEIEFFRDVKIGGKKVIKGKYTLFAIPTPSEWTIILNKDTDIWGAFKYDEKKDVLRTKVPVTNTTEPIDNFTIVFDGTASGANLIIGWDTKMAYVPITFK